MSVDARNNLASRAFVLVFIVLLAGCANDPVQVTKLERDEPSYMLVARPWFGGRETIKQELTAKAQQVCAQSGIFRLMVEEPDYIGSDLLPPRGYVHCR
jgi:hypothetical protein